MRALVDTNVLVRHLTGDPPEHARRASAYLAATADLFVPDVIVAELVYVLESFYERPRPDVATTVRSLLAMPSLSVFDVRLLLRAVELYESERLDFAEAYLAAAAEAWGVGKVASFDRRLDRLDTIERIEP